MLDPSDTPPTLAVSRKRATEIAHGYASFTSMGDPGLVLYQFASTGRVLSEAHREEITAYIEGHCRRAAAINAAAGDEDDSPALDTLLAYIQAAPVENQGAFRMKDVMDFIED